MSGLILIALLLLTPWSSAASKGPPNEICAVVQQHTEGTI